MELLYLGTAASEGWPGIFCSCEACRKATALGGKNIRRRSGAVIDNQFLIELSPDLYMHKLNLSLTLEAVRHIFVTHQHMDHFYPDMLDLKRLPFAVDTQPLTVYGNRYVAAEVEKILSWRKEQKDLPIVARLVKPFETFAVEDLKVTPLPARHGAQDSLFYLFERQKRLLLYAHDTGVFDKEIWTFLRNVKLDCVSLDCTNGPTTSDYEGHMGFREIIEIKERMLRTNICDAQTLFIANHFSHGGGWCHEEMENYLLPYDFLVSYDGLQVRL